MAKLKLLAALVALLAIGGVAATGAFTTVSAERTATVGVAGDSAALLGVSSADNGPFGAAVSEGTNSGVAEINLDSNAFGNAQGLNPQANTSLSPLVNVTNNGEEDVGVTITVESVDTGANIDSNNVTILDENGNSIEGDTTTLTPGQTLQFGLNVDLRNVDQSDLNNNDLQINIQIEASSEDA